MVLTILKAENHRRMPWKNGGGITVEIAIHPQAASVEDFDWRLSMATVASDGPFSVFPGIDRTLSVLEGDGIVLDIEGQATPLTRESAPLAFAADARVSARLIGSLITDLNVMTRRGRFRHSVSRQIIVEPREIESRGDVTLIYLCGAGVIRLADRDVACEAGDTIKLEKGRFELAPMQTLELFIITIRDASPSPPTDTAG